MCIDTTPFWIKILKTVVPPLIIAGIYLGLSFKNKNYKRHLIKFIIIFLLVGFISFFANFRGSSLGC